MTVIDLLLIGYVLGFIICAYFAIVGTNEAIEYNNRKVRKDEK